MGCRQILKMSFLPSRFPPNFRAECRWWRGRITLYYIASPNQNDREQSPLQPLIPVFIKSCVNLVGSLFYANATKARRQPQATRT
jgi:hypothetical protein